MGRRFYREERRLPSRACLLHDNIMYGSLPNTWTDPLALSAGVGARLALAGGVAVLLWLSVLWAMAA